MNSYPRLKYSLINRAARDPRQGFGQHVSDVLRNTSSGMIISNTSFDPSIHEIKSIDPNSLDEDYYTYPRAILRQPEIKSKINIVVSFENENPALVPKTVTESKLSITRLIIEVLTSSKPSEDAIDINRTNCLSLKDIQQLAKTGLTIILSDFNKFVDDSVNITRNAIGVKINHPIEVGEIPKSIGRITLSGGLHECNTNNAKELREVNESLKKKHEETIELLKKRGVPVLSLENDFNNKQQRRFFNNDLPKGITELKYAR